MSCFQEQAQLQAGVLTLPLIAIPTRPGYASRGEVHIIVAHNDLLPNTKPVESKASGVLKLDSSGVSHYLIAR